MNHFSYFKEHKNELKHHGIKGQKWGIRRFQNEDGSYTSEGKARYYGKKQLNYVKKTSADINRIIKTMNHDDRDKVLAGQDEYLTEDQYSTVVKRLIGRYKNTPVSFFDIMQEDDQNLNISLGVRSGKKYRGKGYGSKIAKQGMDWIEKNKSKLSQNTVTWGVRTDNDASIKIAKKNGFVLDDTSYSDDGKWVNYVKKIK